MWCLTRMMSDAVDGAHGTAVVARRATSHGAAQSGSGLAHGRDG